MVLQRGAGACQLRVLVRELDQVGHDGPARGAVVAEQDFGGAQMQLLDGGQPRQPEGLARDHHRQRQRGGGGKGEAEEAEAFTARKQVLDQVEDAEPGAEQHQSADGGKEQRAPAKTAAHRNQRRINRHRQQRRIALRRDAHRAAGRAAGVIRIHHDHAGIVELERRRPPMRRFLVHCSRSPIRN